jgi:hypothetical protein
MPDVEKEAGLEDWQIRVIDERTALDDKILKLGMFLNSVEYGELLSLDRELLRSQHEIMGLYTDVLGKRIERFFT